MRHYTIFRTFALLVGLVAVPAATRDLEMTLTPEQRAAAMRFVECPDQEQAIKDLCHNVGSGNTTEDDETLIAVFAHYIGGILSSPQMTTVMTAMQAFANEVFDTIRQEHGYSFEHIPIRDLTVNQIFQCGDAVREVRGVPMPPHAVDNTKAYFEATYPGQLDIKFCELDMEALNETDRRRGATGIVPAAIIRRFVNTFEHSYYQLLTMPLADILTHYLPLLELVFEEPRIGVNPSVVNAISELGSEQTRALMSRIINATEVENLEAETSLNQYAQKESGLTLVSESMQAADPNASSTAGRVMLTLAAASLFLTLAL